MNQAASASSVNNHGFTLIEVLGAIFLTTIVLAVAVSLFINLSNQSERAVEVMRTDLRASAVLDRVARDLAGASLLVRPSEDTDPNAHPWFFTSESQNAFGSSDSLKFISRNQRPSIATAHASELAQIAYFTTFEEDGSATLYRWSSSSLPPDYQPGFPGPDDPNSFVVAENLGAVTFRFRTEEGEWVDEWDSKQLIQSDQLPTVVEIMVEAAPTANEDFLLQEQPKPYVRQIVIQQRPIDLSKMVEEKIQAQQLAAATAAATDDEDAELDEDGNPIEDDTNAANNRSTVGACVQANIAACNQQFGADNCAVWSRIQQLKISDFGVTLPPEWGCQ